MAAAGIYEVHSQQELDDLLVQQCGWTFSKWDPVDFDREYVILYYDGPRGSGGNPFNVLGAGLQRGRIQINLEEELGCAGGLIIVFPAVLLAIPRGPAGAGVEASVDKVPCHP